MIVNENDPVVVNTGAPTVVVNIPLGHSRKLTLQFRNDTQALSDFDVFGKAHGNAPFMDFTPANWASLTAGSRVQRASGNLAAQAANSDGWFEMDVDGLIAVEIRAVAAVNGASVTPRWSLR